MSIEMPDRGPDSAGVAVYLNPANRNGVKLRLFSADDGYSWRTLAKNVGKELGDKISIEARASRAVLVVHEDFPVIQAWLGVHHPDLKVMSAGNTIEIFGERGLLKDVVGRLKLRDLKGTHALGHTCIATESAITTGLSHPFSAGLDLCWCTTARSPITTGCVRCWPAKV